MQISLADHLTSCEAAMRRMKARNPHRQVIDVSAQIIIQQAQTIARLQTQLSALETETKRIVVTDVDLL